MKYLLLGACAALGMSTHALAETPLMAPVHQFIDAFNKGDEKGAAKAFAPGSITITDEVAPYNWSGPQALKQWSKALMADSAKQGLTDEAVTLGTATREDMVGDHGYVVVQAVYSFTQKGAAMREPAQMVYSLKQSGGHWLIAGWTWTGGKIEPAAK